MKQRVEELEKEVNSYRQQGATSTGDDRGIIDGDIIIVDGSVAREPTTRSGTNERGRADTRRTAITADKGTPEKPGRAASSSTHLENQSDNHGRAKEIGAGPTTVITPGPSPPLQCQIVDTVSSSRPHSSRPHLQTSSVIGDSGVQPQSQSYGAMISQSHGSPHSTGDPRETLRSPTNLASAAYINPGLLSEARPTNSFAQPYYSPPMSNLGTFPLNSYMDFSMAPLDNQGRFSPHGNEWPWPNAASSDNNRCPTRDQGDARGMSNFS